MNVSEAFKSRSMKSMLGDHALRNGLPRIPYDPTRKTSVKLLPGSNPNHMRGTLILKKGRTGSVLSAMNKLGMYHKSTFISSSPPPPQKKKKPPFITFHNGEVKILISGY